MANRSVAWVKDGGLGLEFAAVNVQSNLLTASGVAVGTAPMAYRLDYELLATDGFITSKLAIWTEGEGWSRRLELHRSRSGKWSIDTLGVGAPALPKAGGDAGEFGDALDCDIALSPLTNTMPVLRHSLLGGGGPLDFVMAWVSVPDLSVHRSGQRYTFLRREGANSIVRYESSDRSFTADLVFDQDGLVVEYPGIGHRVG